MESFDNRFTSQVDFNFNCVLNKEEGNYVIGIGKATHHAQLALPSRLWRIEVRYLCAHVRPVNYD